MTIGQETLHFSGMHEAYPVLRDQILARGKRVAPRGEPTLEVLGASFTIADAVGHGVPLGTGRKVGIKMQAIDGTGNFAGASYPDVAIRLAKVMDRFADDLPDPRKMPPSRLSHQAEEICRRQPNLRPGARFFQGAYGPRIGDQLECVEQQLRRDPDTRQAIVSLWSETDRNPAWKDRPCTTEFQLMIRDGALDIFVFMRANDLWTGTCYDVFQFGQIQAAMANILGVPVGTYHHYATSLHIYERDLEKFEEVRRWKPERWVDAGPNAEGTTHSKFRRQVLVEAEPAVVNPRESWGPDWSAEPAGQYESWVELRTAYTGLLEAASLGKDFSPMNAVEQWYWNVVNQINEVGQA